MIYRYFLLLRPPLPGTFPEAKTRIGLHGYGTRKFVESIRREAWGYVDYSEPLTKKQIDDYELIEEVE